MDLHALDLGILASHWLKELVDNEDNEDYLRRRYPDIADEDFEAVMDKMREVVDAGDPDPDVGAAALGRLHRRWEEASYDEASVERTL